MGADLVQLETKVTPVLAGLDARQTQFTPLNHPEKWSIQQIVEHLLLTYRATCSVMEERLTKGTPTRAVPSIAQRLGQFGIIRLGLFPPGRPAPAAVSPSLPATLRSGDDLALRIHTDLVRLGDLAARAETVFRSRRAISHIVLGPLSAQQWRRFHLIHGLHHVRQILAIRKDHHI